MFEFYHSKQVLSTAKMFEYRTEHYLHYQKFARLWNPDVCNGALHCYITVVFQWMFGT